MVSNAASGRNSHAIRSHARRAMDDCQVVTPLVGGLQCTFAQSSVLHVGEGISCGSFGSEFLPCKSPDELAVACRSSWRATHPARFAAT